jgi:hypothetical protein
MNFSAKAERELNDLLLLKIKSFVVSAASPPAAQYLFRTSSLRGGQVIFPLRISSLTENTAKS